MYDHGARNRNPVSTLWYGIDPLWEKYPDFSPYNYCAGNPVKLVDPDGREIVLGESLLVDFIKQTVPAHMRKYISVDANGLIDNNLLQKGLENENDCGLNYQSLCEISFDSRKVHVTFNDDIIVYNQQGDLIPTDKLPYNFSDPISDEYNNFTPELVGFVGSTYAPLSHQWEEKDASIFNEREMKLFTNNQDYSVQLNGRGKFYQSTYRSYVKILAHELYGHAKFMLNGKSALHYSGARSGESSNNELENHIKQSVNEADNNCNY